MKTYYIEQSDADIISSLDYAESVRIESRNAEQVELVDNVETVKRELNRKMMLANKYGYDEYADELARLLEKLDTFRKARK